MANSDGKTLLLLKPRGFCAGVVRAIDIVRIALEAFGPPIYVRKEIVHNRFVVEELQSKGAIFVDNVDEVPDGERVIYSAHGVSPEVREASEARNLRVIDATCPLVTKVHVEAVKFAKEGYSLILIGHRDHDEVIGTLGEAPVVTQVVGSPEEVAVTVGSRPQPRSLSDPDHFESGRNERHHRRVPGESFPTSTGRPRRTSAMPRKTGRWRLNMWRPKPICYWWLVPTIAPIPTDW